MRKIIKVGVKLKLGIPEEGPRRYPATDAPEIVPTVEINFDNEEVVTQEFDWDSAPLWSGASELTDDENKFMENWFCYNDDSLQAILDGFMEKIYAANISSSVIFTI